MDWPIFFPNVKTKSTKDLIMRLLTEEEFLTNQKIFSQIKKKYGVSVTYQSVRQALLELTESGVLEKNGKNYSLSKKWIETIHNYSTILKKKYVDKQKVTIVNENTREINLNSLFDMGHFILHGFKDNFFDLNKENELYMFVHHLWFPFFNKEKRNSLKDFFSKNKNYIFVRHNTPTDKIFSFFYKRYGKVKLGKKFDEFFDIIIQGDCIAKIYMPTNLRKKMSKIYSIRNPFSMKILEDFSDMNYETHAIKIIITRDKCMADEIKKRMIN